MNIGKNPFPAYGALQGPARQMPDDAVAHQDMSGGQIARQQPQPTAQHPRLRTMVMRIQMMEDTIRRETDLLNGHHYRLFGQYVVEETKPFDWDELTEQSALGSVNMVEHSLSIMEQRLHALSSVVETLVCSHLV